MGICPICKCTADVGQNSSGDFKQFDCPRCGNYQITGTALAMLPSRLEADNTKSRARLSHAIRLMVDTAPPGERPEINSVNLGELVKKPLPSIERQTVNLLRWAAKQLGDDQLGAAELPDEDHFAGIVGTIDANRANDLISLARGDGLIELVPDNCISITRQGWKHLQPVEIVKELKEPVSDQAKSIEEPKVVKAHCNRCNGERRAFVRATHNRQ
jgi:hypothetical protein